MKPEKKLAKKRKSKILHVRKKIFGTPERPRLCFHRTLKHFDAQIIDDVSQTTLVAVSTQEKELKDDPNIKPNVPTAQKVGEIIAERALGKGISKVCFDKRYYKYHGRVKAFAESAKKAGLKF